MGYFIVLVLILAIFESLSERREKEKTDRLNASKLNLDAFKANAQFEGEKVLPLTQPVKSQNVINALSRSLQQPPPKVDPILRKNESTVIAKKADAVVSSSEESRVAVGLETVKVRVFKDLDVGFVLVGNELVDKLQPSKIGQSIDLLVYAAQLVFEKRRKALEAKFATADQDFMSILAKN